MMTGIPLTVVYGRINAFNKTNENKLADSLLNLASGKRVRSPQDSVPDFFRAQRLQSNEADYTRIKADVSEASALMDVVGEAAESVFNGINEMKQLVKMYYDENMTDEKSYIEDRFSSLAKEVSHIIDNSFYDGRQLISDSSSDPLDSVAIDPSDVRNVITVSFGSDQVADVAGLTLGNGKENDLAAVQAELDKAGSYLASANAFSIGLEAQYAIAEKKVTVSNNARNLITDADEGQEMILATTRTIQHQASYAMIAQANMVRSSIVKLFG